MINQDWSIQSRADRCAVTGVEFQDGDYFYTLLFDEGGGLRREDLSETAWQERNDNRQPFSFWRSKFEAEAKRSVEGDLRRVYEHTVTGEVFVVPDPELRLDQIEQVQVEVAALLAPG
jgi:hypothetical protein